MNTIHVHCDMCTDQQSKWWQFYFCRMIAASCSWRFPGIEFVPGIGGNLDIRVMIFVVKLLMYIMQTHPWCLFSATCTVGKNGGNFYDRYWIPWGYAVISSSINTHLHNFGFHIPLSLDMASLHAMPSLHSTVARAFRWRVVSYIFNITEVGTCVGLYPNSPTGIHGWYQ